MAQGRPKANVGSSLCMEFASNLGSETMLWKDADVFGDGMGTTECDVLNFRRIRQ
jgi:hypothetical protein